MRANKQMFLFMLLLFFLLISCSSLKYNKQIVKEGYGIEKYMNISFNKQAIDSVFNKSNPCKTIEGKFIKNSECEYIDTRRYVIKKVENQRCFDKSNVSIVFDKNDIVEIIFFSKKHKTQKGLKVGDKKEKVYHLYGNNYRKSFYSIPSYKTKNVSFNDFGLEIDYFDSIGIGFVYNKNGRVIKILVFKPSGIE